MAEAGKRGAGRFASIGVVAAAMAGLLWWQRVQPAGTSTFEPADCVTAMVDAARAGDVAGYLACFSGAARARIQAQIEAGGNARFGDYLKAGMANLNGLALHDPIELAPDRVRLTLERVYPDYNERQTVELRRGREGWSIDQLEAAERYVPAIRYGTPVSAAPAGARPGPDAPAPSQ